MVTFRHLTAFLLPWQQNQIGQNIGVKNITPTSGNVRPTRASHVFAVCRRFNGRLTFVDAGEEFARRQRLHLLQDFMSAHRLRPYHVLGYESKLETGRIFVDTHADLARRPQGEDGALLARYRPGLPTGSFAHEPAVALRTEIPVPKGPVEVW